MKATYISACLAACFCLSACASRSMPKTAETTTDIDRHIMEAAARIESAQTQLYHSAALSQNIAKPAVPLMDDAQRVTISWKGDALQLLTRLARDRGLSFAQTGVRMPLPVVINVTDEPLAAVIDKIRVQVGYRAVVDQGQAYLLLQYNRPKT